MLTNPKPKTTSTIFSEADIAAAKQAAVSVAPARSSSKIDWSKGKVTQGGGVDATLASLRRARGKNKRPVKEQVAIRFDPEILAAFRADGPGWQTRINAALKDWLASHAPKPR